MKLIVVYDAPEGNLDPDRPGVRILSIIGVDPNDPVLNELADKIQEIAFTGDLGSAVPAEMAGLVDLALAGID